MSLREARVPAECENLRLFSLPKNKDYTSQFNHIYEKRIAVLRQMLVKNSPGVTFIDKIIHMKSGGNNNNNNNNNSKNSTVNVIGTIYKEQKLKPNVLDEFAIQEEYDPREKDHANLSNYTSEDDFLILEDESGRVQLCDLDVATVGKIPTGIVVAIGGTLLESGLLSVKSITYPGEEEGGERASANQQDEKENNVKKKTKREPLYVCLTSDLNFGDVTANDPLALHLFVEFLGGRFSTSSSTSTSSSSRICRLIVAGNVVSNLKLNQEGGGSGATILDSKMTPPAQDKSIEALRLCDRSLAEASSFIPVDVMPGKNDPATITLPQQPLHVCLFPEACRYSNTFHLVTNPYCFRIKNENEDEVLVLGSSGQSLEDVCKVTSGLSKMQVLENTIALWRHISPTSPDSLPCYPFRENDPFVLETRPQVFFAPSGSSEWGSSYLGGRNGTRCVLIPSFGKSGKVVLVDLNSPTFETKLLSFNGF